MIFNTHVYAHILIEQPVLEHNVAKLVPVLEDSLDQLVPECQTILEFTVATDDGSGDGVSRTLRTAKFQSDDICQTSSEAAPCSLH